MKTIKLWILLSGLLVYQSAYTQYGQARIDSLESLLKKPPQTDPELYYAYVRLIEIYEQVDLNKAMEYSRQAIRAATERRSTYWSADFSHITGNVFFALGELDSALYYYARSSELQKQAVSEGTADPNENDYLELYLLRDVGSVHVARGDFDKALDLYFRSMAVAERIEDTEEVLHLYSLLAEVYFRISNYEQAEAYYLKQKQLATETGDSLQIADAYQGLCPLLSARGDQTTALEYAEEAYRILRNQSQAPPGRLMVATMRLTEIWMKILDYDKAMQYAQATVEYARQTSSPTDLASALYTLSTVYLRQGKYTECEQAAFQALEADSTSIYVNSIVYANIAQANIWKGNGAKSIEYFSKTLNANRAFSNKNFQTSLSEMEVKYETEKKEMRIAVLEKERRLMIWLGMAGITVLVLVLVLFLFLWRWTVQKKKVAEQQQVLAEQQQRLAEQQVKQLEQEKQLIATQSILDGETAERTRLARDLHDGLGSMLTGVKLNLESMKQGIRLDQSAMDGFNNALSMLSESMTEMRRVAHHLMPDSLSRYGLKVALTDFCGNFPSVEFNYFGNEERLDPKMEVLIYRVVYELVNNALKHSGATQIMVQVLHETDYIGFIVRDNGHGFDHDTETQGMGLRNIRARVTSYNGQMEIYSRQNEGTEINIEFKLTQ